jgi:hypothetical protein
MKAKNDKDKTDRPKDYVIVSPDFAHLRYGLDVSSNEGTLIISATVHYAEKLSICYVNLWVQERGFWRRLHEKEIISPKPPDLSMLVDIITQFRKSERVPNVRIELGLKRLLNSLNCELNKS